MDIPIMEVALIEAFLKTQFVPNISEVQFLGSGMFSQAFSFCCDRKFFVIRFNSYIEDYQKDIFAYQNFASDQLPIPKVLLCDGFYNICSFAITERCSGFTLKELDKSAIDQVLPSLFTALNALHRSEANTSGWGLTNAAGQGQFGSWEAYLLSFYNQKFAFTWEQLLEETFLEKQVYEDYLARFQHYLPFCSTSKYWVHGDVGLDNLIADSKTTTGIIDWAELRLGDFVYDIACLELDLRWNGSSCLKQWQTWAEDHISNSLLDHFTERMQCYFWHIGLSSLAIAATKNDFEDYTQVKAFMQRLLTED